MNAIAALLYAIQIATPAPAAVQNSDGWTVTEASGVLIASASYESGQSFVVRCRDRRLDVMMTGVPAEAGSKSRWLEWTPAGGDRQRQTWFNLADRPMVFAARPVHVARILRKGGSASVRLLPTTETPRAHRYDLPLPSDGAGLDQVLTACKIRLDDPRDDLVEVDPPFARPGVYPLAWEKLATPAYPNTAISAGAGEVLFSCVVAEAGRLRDCRVEQETPPRVGFGQATLAALPSARLRLGPGIEPGRLMIARMLYRLD
jgi:hypothetical protein